MKSLLSFYRRIEAMLNTLQSPLLLAIRLYWGFQLAQTGWGKLHNLPKITAFFASLNIPLPGVNAPFIAGLEFFGGILLMLGLFSRPVAFLMTCNMLVAYITADREALFSVFSDPDKFTAAAPYVFLFASLLILIFGPGYLSLDYLLLKRLNRSSETTPR
jgi:putative oxidoreductase